MKKQALVLMLSMLCTTAAYASTGRAAEAGNAAQTVYRATAHNVFHGGDAHFTGDTRIETLFPANATTHYSSAYVTFQAGARSDWHSHPVGQHIIVISGTLLTGTRGGKVIRATAGDTVWCPPGVDHWHGATPDAPVTTLVVTGELDGKNIVWKEPVSDTQYNERP